MTARDDAIEAITEELVAATDFDVHDPADQFAIAAGLLDAVPPRVLAQLAIDAGALKDTKWCFDANCTGPHESMYRLVDPEVTA